MATTFFWIGYYFDEFRSQVAISKEVNFTPWKGDFLEKLSLEPTCMDVLSQTLIQVIDSTVHYNTENIWKVHLCLTLANVFFQCILTNNIHINCSVPWFTKAIVCWTVIFSCISPVDVVYIQHLSFLHHNSISLVPRLLFGPGDVWFYFTRCFAD